MEMLAKLTARSSIVLAERVDAVDWERLERIADREMREFDLPAAWEIISGMLDNLNFPDIRVVAYTQKPNDIGLFTVAPTVRNHTRNVENGMAVTLHNYSSSSIAGVTRRILEAVREWSVTDAEGGAK